MKKNPTFESCIAELESMLEQLSDETTPLDASVALYAKAAEKINACTKMLQDAKLQVEQIDLQLSQKEEE